jgi:hypothetical protein
VFLSFLKVVLKGFKQAASKGCSAWDVCEGNVTISSLNACVYSIASRVTWDPWPLKMNKCLFVKKIPFSIDILRKKEFFENKYNHPCYYLHSHIGPWFANIMRKRGVLQLALQFNF